MWESISLQGRCGSVGIQVSCSAEDHSAVRDGRFPVSKYSRTSLYIAGHLPHPDTLSNQAIKQSSHHIYHTFQQKVDDNTYQEAEPRVQQTHSNKLPLTVWQKRFGHINFPALRKHLTRHNIHYNDDERVCDSCERAKATKHYICMPQERAKRPYEFIRKELVGPITPVGFGAERYFFTFTDTRALPRNTLESEKANGSKASKASTILSGHAQASNDQ